VSRDGSVPEHVLAGAWHQLGTYAAWRVPNDTPEAAYRLPPPDTRAVQERMAAGTPDQVVAAIGPWLEAYGRRDLTVVFRLHYPGMTRAQARPALELFAHEVIPALKRMA
jgi:alkanesulfonate monooxygenase SsuD/methylene tetrahydromethanopterin reductase-like flavin-dependent oxidoreductase (luciferase family)